MARNTTVRRRRGAGVAVLASAVLSASLGVSTAAAATPTELFISEYVDGASGNQAVEIFNGTPTTVDLGAGNYGIYVYANGSATPTATVPLEGSVANGDVFVVGNSLAVGDIFTVSDLRTTELNFNGNDAVALVNLSTGSLIDLIGQIGVNPGATGWGSGEVVTNDRTLVRKPSISAGRTANDAFDPTAEWTAFPFDTTSQLGSHTFDGGGSDTGTVDATIAMAASSVCIALSATAVDFGSGQFGRVDVLGSPEVVVTNCSTTSVTLLARGTDATGTGATWNLVNNSATCADTLGTDNYHLRLHEGQTPDVFWSLGTTNTALEDVAPDGIGQFVPLIDTACPGSSGAGQQMSMQIVFVAVEPAP